jgi:hypothetical protein
LGALLVAKVSFEPDGALEGVAAAIPAMVVRHGYLDVGKREFPSSRQQPYRHRRARGERSAQQLVRVRPRRRAPPAVGAADRELRCAGTAVERAGAIKVAGYHSLWAGSAIVVRIRHRAFLSDFDWALGSPVRAGRGSRFSLHGIFAGASACIGAVSRSLIT